MKRLFPIWAFLALLLAGGCSKYDDSTLTGRVNELEQRMQELERLCKESNTNISSLQTLVSAVQSGDYVKEVTPVMQDGKEVGSTITFGKGNPITIYHDKASNTGSGTMPVIGVRQDESGTFYWTLNGEWLLDDAGNKIKAQGSDGKDGEVGRPGQDGTDGKDGEDGKPGQNGADGKDGITPQLKIENDFWFVSTDNGNTWTNLGKATTGSNSSDPMFQEIKQDDHNIYFTLASGEKITIPKTSGLSISFQEGNTLLFNVDETKTIHYTITGGGENSVVKVEMLNADGGYTLHTNSTSATAGTIKILAKIPTKNRVIVSVSDGNHTIMAAIDVSLPPSFDGQTVNVETPGTLSRLLAGYNHTTITELTVVGSINNEDIATLKALSNLSVLDIENTDLTELPSRAFYKNKTLISIKLPQNLTTIGNSASEGCSGLTSITIPGSVQTIGSSAFSGCSGLTGNLMIPKGVTTIGESAFSGCSGLTGNLMIPEGITEIGNFVFSDCSSLTSVTIPEGVTTIGSSAFSGCSGLTGNLMIPKGVTTIGESAFSGCSGLTGNLMIPEGVTTIGESAFSGCSGLTGNLIIPEGITEIGNFVFSGCSSLTSVTIPEGVTTIGKRAFYNCSGFTGNLTLPKSVTTIAGHAFMGCKMTQIYCKSDTPPQLIAPRFILEENCDLYVPIGCVESYRTAEGWKEMTFKNIIETEF